ncbi:MAG: hypothetical protein DI587_32150 [Variovorax paradoxus]|nr:MAG: hypothetical protein DI583_32150 [Variovorax paradoxus]PZQ02719.1 MAG: hypothetical protein DI587_32150 [Variovorax paradoxus]
MVGRDLRRLGRASGQGLLESDSRSLQSVSRAGQGRGGGARPQPGWLKYLPGVAPSDFLNIAMKALELS